MSASLVSRTDAVHLTEVEEDTSDPDQDLDLDQDQDQEQETSEHIEYTDSGPEETTRSELQDRHSTTSSSIGSLSLDNDLAMKYLEFQKKEKSEHAKSSTNVVNFFINMGETVNTFPARVQSRVKAAVFRIVNEEEMANARKSSQAAADVLVFPKSHMRESSTEVAHHSSSGMKTSSSIASIASDGTQVSVSYHLSTGVSEISVAPKYAQ